MRIGFPAVFVSFIGLAAIGQTACSSAPEPATANTPPAASVPDKTGLFPDADRTSATVAPNHILNMKTMPGGSLAQYDTKGEKYQMFIIDADTAEKAMFLMLDMKGEMGKDPEYISYMGGYFGTYRDQPFYCFAKLHYVAGVVGLPKDQADPMARKLAAHLR